MTEVGSLGIYEVAILCCGCLVPVLIVVALVGALLAVVRRRRPAPAAPMEPVARPEPSPPSEPPVKTRAAAVAEPAVKSCPSCGADNPVGNASCEYCGASFPTE